MAEKKSTNEKFKRNKGRRRRAIIRNDAEDGRLNHAGGALSHGTSIAQVSRRSSHRRRRHSAALKNIYISTIYVVPINSILLNKKKNKRRR